MYLKTVSVSFDCFFLQISNKSVAEPGTHDVSQEKQVHKNAWQNAKQEIQVCK